jgi:hypothetical protein
MTPATPMTRPQAIKFVLIQAGTPLYVKEIDRRISEQRLMSTIGKTPEKSVSSYLSASVMQLDSEFIWTAPATYALRSVPVVDALTPPELEPLDQDEAMRRFASLRSRYSVGESLQHMIQLTSPFRVARLPPEDVQFKPCYLVLLVHGHGNEEELWEFLGDHRERDAVRMSVLLRNIYVAGHRAALRT